MEKSLCSLAVLIFLGGFFDAALMDDASTESHYSVFSNATATTATPTTAASVTAERDHPAAQTTAQSRLPAATTVRVNRLDGKNRDRDEDSREEDRDDSTGGDTTQLGRTEKL